MSDLDALIYKLAFAGFLALLIKREAFIPVVLVCASFIFNELVFIKSPSWDELSRMYAMYALKDFLISIALFCRHRKFEFMLGLFFMASSVFHQAMQIQIYNYVLDLKHIRTEFMTYVTVFQLATMYLLIFTSKGDWNGGKRAKRYLPNADYGLNRFFHLPTLKAFKCSQNQPI